MKNITIAILISVAFSVGGTIAAEEQNHHSDGTRCVPLHRLGLKDLDNRTILPTMKRATPMSTRNTCGACHDYGVIAKGLHFNSSKAKSSGRPGEPWVLLDAATGTQLPLSNRSWAGLHKPADVGLTPWSFTKLFGRHMPGGDMAAPGDTSDITARWGVSGAAEINCMGCHNASYKQDHSEWARQMMRENFRWAGTAAAGLGEVGGMASRQPDMWDIYQGPSPDDTGYATPPAVNYDKSLFDSKGRAMLDVGSPKDKRCLSCHSTVRAGESKWRSDRDVHSSAGLSCVQCHRNGISHNIVRGYDGESAQRNDPDVASLSCRGCHLGTGAQGARAMGGRLGAPTPKHAGLPPVHLERLTCTACHSGPMPKSEPTRIRTARANRMGIFGRAQWYTEAPNISEGVFAKGADGKIGPVRMIWPAFWGRLEGGKVTPLLPDEVSGVTKGVLDAPRQIARVLNALAGPIVDEAARINSINPALIKIKKIGGRPILLHEGKIYRLNADGGLDVSELSGEAPIAIGPLARDFNGEILILLRDLDPEADFLHDHPPKASNISVVVTSMLKALAAEIPDRGAPVLDYGDATYQRGLVATPTEEDKGKMTWRLVKTGTGGERRDVPRFAWLDGGKIRPLISESVIQSAAGTAEVEESFTEPQVQTVLKKLQESKGGRFVYISGGKMFALGSDGKVAASGNAAADAYSWPMAHGVRPAAQALGAGGCTDCHSLDSAFFFGKVRGAGPLLTDSVAVKSMYELQEMDAGFHRLFGLTFIFRPIFKAVLFAAAILMAVILAAYAALAIRKTVKFAGGTDKFCFPLLDKLAGLVVCGLTAVLVVTGFFNPVLFGATISGWLLMTHVLLGAVFAVALLALIVFRAAECGEEGPGRFSLGQKIGFWMLAGFGFCLLLTAALATLPVIDMGWQALMACLHLYMGIGAVLASLVYIVATIRKKKV